MKREIKKVLGTTNVAKLAQLRRHVRRYLTAVRFHARYMPNLKLIGDYYGTDKGDTNHTFHHLSYLDIYNEYLHDLRNKDIAVLEIGVKNGASLRMWKKYFRRAQIYGIDIDPDCAQYEEDRIRISIGSQDDVSFLSNCFQDDTEFDVIIDDGSHINRHIIGSFNYLFYNRLRSGGYYIIEDMKCSYVALQTELNVLERWPGMRYNDPTQSYNNDRNEMDRFFADMLYELDHLKGEVLHIHFWSALCVLAKI
ncbi:MAG: class I SAM-dependent methyltransferase [Chloroflexi bacterium]|nr:class I SAM-dependent methyltransferase [Chloroflexota bacterium]